MMRFSPRLLVSWREASGTLLDQKWDLQPAHGPCRLTGVFAPLGIAGSRRCLRELERDSFITDADHTHQIRLRWIPILNRGGLDAEWADLSESSKDCPLACLLPLPHSWYGGLTSQMSRAPQRHGCTGPSAASAPFGC